MLINGHWPNPTKEDEEIEHFLCTKTNIDKKIDFRKKKDILKNERGKKEKLIDKILLPFRRDPSEQEY